MSVAKIGVWSERSADKPPLHGFCTLIEKLGTPTVNVDTKREVVGLPPSMRNPWRRSQVTPGVPPKPAFDMQKR